MDVDIIESMNFKPTQKEEIELLLKEEIGANKGDKLSYCGWALDLPKIML